MDAPVQKSTADLNKVHGIAKRATRRANCSLSTNRDIFAWRPRNRAAGGRLFSAAGSSGPAPKDARMDADGPLSMLRPVLWLAAAAFAVGFGGYLAVAASAHGG